MCYVISVYVYDLYNLSYNYNETSLYNYKLLCPTTYQYSYIIYIIVLY